MLHEGYLVVSKLAIIPEGHREVYPFVILTVLNSMAVPVSTHHVTPRRFRSRYLFTEALGAARTSAWYAGWNKGGRSSAVQGSRTPNHPKDPLEVSLVMELELKCGSVASPGSVLYQGSARRLVLLPVMFLVA